MKKIFAIISLFALVFTSCQKDEMIFMGSELDTLTATMESSTGTKATLQDGTNNTFVVWEYSDLISVFVQKEGAAQPTNVKYRLDDGEGSTEGTFVKAEDFDMTGATVLAAIYPYTEGATYSNGTINGLSTSDSYNYSTTEKVGPMAAKANGTNLAFKNIGSLIQVSTAYIPSGYTSIELSSATSNLSGSYSVTLDNEGIPTANLTGTNKTITFTETDETQTVYFPIFAGIYSDLTVKAKGEDKSDITLISPKTLSAVRSTIYQTNATVNTIASNLVELSATDNKNIIINTDQGSITVKEEENNNVTGNVNIVIDGGSTERILDVTLPNATVELSGAATYSNINASTAENTLILGNGVTANQVTVLKGNIKVNEGATLTKVVRGTDLPEDTKIYIINNTGNTLNIADLPNNVQIVNPTEYAEIKLKEAAENGGTYTLTRDITLSEKLVIQKDLAIFGNGKTITYTGSDRAIDVAKETPDVNLTIKDLTINYSASYCERGISYNANGNLTLDNVIVEGTNVTYALNIPGASDGANVEIKNSKLTGKIALNIWGKNATINVIDSHLTSIDNTDAENYTAINLNNNGQTSAEGSTITVTGGSITAKDENGNDSNAYMNATDTGMISVSETTTIVGKVGKQVAIIYYENTDNFYSLSTIQGAINRVSQDKVGKIRLTSDVELTESLNISAGTNINLDLNNHTITLDAEDDATEVTDFNNHGTLTIKNGSIIASEKELSRRCIYNRSGGTMTIENMTFSQTYSSKGAAINNEGTMTISNSTVNAIYYSIWTSGTNATTTVYSGTYTTTNDIQDRSTWAYTVNVQNGATLNVQDGEFTGNHGVIGVIAGSKANLYDGTYTCTAEYTGNSDWALYASGSGSVINYDNTKCNITSANPSGISITEDNGQINNTIETQQ